MLHEANYFIFKFIKIIRNGLTSLKFGGLVGLTFTLSVSIVTSAKATSCVPGYISDIGIEYIASTCQGQATYSYAQYDLDCVVDSEGGTVHINRADPYAVLDVDPEAFLADVVNNAKWWSQKVYVNESKTHILVVSKWFGSINNIPVTGNDPPNVNGDVFGVINPTYSLPCCLTTGTPSATASFKPSMGETASISANTTSNYPINWTLTINGATSSGSGSPSYTWDGKNNGFPVAAGVYNASIGITSGGCTGGASVPIAVVEPPKTCQLDAPIGSSANVATGNLSFSQEVFSVKGGASPLGFSLFYNSLDTIQGSLGASWKHNYDISLQNSDNGGKVLVEGGTRHVYTWDGTYHAETGDTSKLEKNGDTHDLTFVDGRKYHFYADGKLDTITDKYLNVLTFEYDDDSNLISVTDGLRTISLEYDPVVTNRLATVKDPNNNIFTFSFQDNQNMLWKVINPVTDAGVPASYWQYTYNSDNLLQFKKDPGNFTIEYGYSGKRVNYSIDPNGQTRDISYPPATGNVRTTTLTEKDGSDWEYTYDIQSGFLKEKNLLGGKKTSYYYNTTDATLRAKTEPFDNNYLTTFYTYDSNGNILTQTDPVDISTYINPTIDPQTVDIASLANRAPAIKTALSYTYDAANFDQVATVTDERFTPFRTTSYAYTTENGLKVTTVTDPEGKQTITRYNSNGTIAELQDGNLKKTIYSYHPDNADNQTAGIVGLLQTVTTPDNIVTSYTSYDKNGNSLEIKVKGTDQHVQRTVQEYDALNRLRKVTRNADNLPDNITRYGYDNNNNRNSVIDPETHETQYLFNFQGQATKVTDARQKETIYEYGSSGCPSCTGVDKLTSIIDARQKKTEYLYDSLGRLERETDPLKKVIRYTYYDNNLLKEKIDATIPTAELILVTHYYDNNGKLTKKHYADNTEAIFDYYPDGALKTATNQNISYGYTYYKNGWLKSVSDITAGLPGTLIASYDEYDNIGQRKTVNYFPATQDARTITYHYDPDNNRLDTITSAAGSFGIGYDNMGRRKTVTYPNGVIATSGYDDLNRLNSLVHAPQIGPTITSSGYTHYPAGNRETKTGTINETYLYDEIYRLTKAITPRGTENFTYDEVGNRQTGPGPRDTGYQYNAGNQITAGRTLSYQYDNQGNQTQRIINNAPDKSWIYAWDYENRLTKIEKGKGTSEKRTTSFKYDPLGRRIEKKHVTSKDVTVEGVTTTINKTTTTTYIYDGDNVIFDIFDDGVTPIKTFYTHSQGEDEHLALERSGSFYYYHADGLGSITAITDADKNVVQRYTYDSYGVPTSPISFRNSYLFAGREWDSETGLYFNRARYYDPYIGRFISRDPIAFAGGDVNLFAYVQNNPINLVDPSGLLACAGCHGGLAWDKDKPSDPAKVEQLIKKYWCESGGNASKAFDQSYADRQIPNRLQGFDLSLRDAEHYFYAYLHPQLGFAVPLYSVAKQLGFDYPGASKPSLSETRWGMKGALDGLRGYKPDMKGCCK